MATLKILIFAVCVSMAYCAIVGGWTDVKPDDEEIVNMATDSVARLQAQSNSMYAYKVIRVTDARSKVRGVCLLY